MTKPFRIGELANETGLTADTIRYYERLGLLPRPARSSGGFRLYSERAVERLRFIAQAKALDLTLQEIRELATFDGRGGIRRCRRVRDLLAKKLDEIEHKLAELHDLRDTLATSLDRCNGALGVAASDDDCPVIETLQHRR